MVSESSSENVAPNRSLKSPIGVSASTTYWPSDWMAICAEARIPAMRANRLTEIFDDPHFKATGYFEERHLPGEAGGYRSMKPGLKFAKTPASVRRDPPSLGQHTDEVLKELGLSS